MLTTKSREFKTQRTLRHENPLLVASAAKRIIRRQSNAALLACLLTFVGVMPSWAVDAESFKTPPNADKPTIWWFWGETITTDRGITQDLEALKRVGFGGAVLYEQVFSDRLDAMKSLSPQWMARVRFAAAECARLGLSLEVNAGPGYVAGGPWISPEMGMQRLVSSELEIEGGRKLSRALPKPKAGLNFYRDVAVLAYPSPAGSEAVQAPTIASEPTGLDLAALFNLLGLIPRSLLRIELVSAH